MQLLYVAPGKPKQAKPETKRKSKNILFNRDEQDIQDKKQNRFKVKSKPFHPVHPVNFVLEGFIAFYFAQPS
jgi:hypothetical protein